MNPPYIALAQVQYENGDVEAFGVEKGILDFEYLAKAILKNKANSFRVNMFDNRLVLQGVYYRESV